MVRVVKPVAGICPFDSLPCAYVSSCDDALSWRIGFVIGEGSPCSRAVFKVRKK